MKNLLLPCLLAGLSVLTAVPSAFAATPAGIDAAAFVGAAAIKRDSSFYSLDGDGQEFGLRLAVGQPAGLFGGLEFTRTSADNDSSSRPDSDVTDVRLGLGYARAVSAAARQYLQLQYAMLKYDAEYGDSSLMPTSGGHGTTDATGFALAVGGSLEVGARIGLYGRLGYAMLDADETGGRLKGLETMAGLKFALGPKFAVFGELRHADYNHEDGFPDINLRAQRAGVSFLFSEALAQ